MKLICILTFLFIFKDLIVLDLESFPQEGRRNKYAISQKLKFDDLKI